MKFLLDTNVISELRKRDRGHPNVVRWTSTVEPHDIATSVVVLGELRRGIELKRRSDPEQGAILEQWFLNMRGQLGDRVLPVDEIVAERWGLLNVPNRLPLIDGLIAATAIVHGLTIVTRNMPDFAKTGVALLNPFEH